MWFFVQVGRQGRVVLQHAGFAVLLGQRPETGVVTMAAVVA